MKSKIRSIVNFGKDFASGMGERRLTVYATSGCYYLFMSLVPIVMIICCILPYTPFDQETILGYIDVYFAESLGTIVRRIVNAVYASNAATLTVSILLTLFSASASMKSLMNGMNAAYNVKKKSNIVIFTLKALFYMILLGVALILSLVIMVYGGLILNLLTSFIPSVGILGWLLSKSRYLLVMLALGLVFLFLYYMMPGEKVKLKNQIPGALFSAIIWVLFSGVFTVYIGISDKYGAYGFIGTIMVAMMWMYYCLFFLLIGGFLNSFLTERRLAPAGEASFADFAPENDVYHDGSYGDGSYDDLYDDDLYDDDLYDAAASENDAFGNDVSELPDSGDEDVSRSLKTASDPGKDDENQETDAGSKKTNVVKKVIGKVKALPKGVVIGIAAGVFSLILSAVVLIYRKKGFPLIRKLKKQKNVIGDNPQ